MTPEKSKPTQNLDEVPTPTIPETLPETENPASPSRPEQPEQPAQPEPAAPKSSKKPFLLRLLPPLILTFAALAIYFFVDFTSVSDWFRARDYTPTSEMSQIISALPLTDRGLLILRASHPTLRDNPDFGSVCGSDQEGTSILGCFTNSDIYIKNITDPELSGILESTTAHELLHAVWSRLDESARKDLTVELDALYKEHQSTLASRLTNYESSRWHDELHSIFGTEFADLPPTLASHYAEIFADRARIVTYFDSYNSKFQDLRAESEALRVQIEQLKTQIAAGTKNYEDGSEELNIAIADFRRRAENGYFGNNISAFYREQAELQARADTLTALFDQINTQISEVNILIERYNENATTLNDLSSSISSPSTPPSVD